MNDKTWRALIILVAGIMLFLLSGSIGTGGHHLGLPPAAAGIFIIVLMTAGLCGMLIGAYRLVRSLLGR